MSESIFFMYKEKEVNRILKDANASSTKAQCVQRTDTRQLLYISARGYKTATLPLSFKQLFRVLYLLNLHKVAGGADRLKEMLRASAWAKPEAKCNRYSTLYICWLCLCIYYLQYILPIYI